MEPTNLDRVVAYLRAIETRDPSLCDYFDPEVVQRELPNRLIPDGATRCLADLKRGAEKGKQVLVEERYEIVSALEAGSRVALEVRWTGLLAIPIGATPAGGTLRAHLSMFFTFRAGRIVELDNYDCYEPF